MAGKMKDLKITDLCERYVQLLPWYGWLNMPRKLWSFSVCKWGVISCAFVLADLSLVDETVRRDGVRIVLKAFYKSFLNTCLNFLFLMA